MAGLGAWALWPSRESAVAVPDRVCGSALPGATVRDLLPEHGKGFEEEVVGSSSPLLDPDGYGPEDIAQDAGKPGNVLISWGANRGGVEGNTVTLYVGCESSDRRDSLLEVSTSVNGADGKLKDRATREKAVALAADTARFVAARVDFCEPTPLPDTAPKIG